MGLAALGRDPSELEDERPTVRRHTGSCLSAWVATLVELVGGGLLVVGLAVPVVGVLLTADMLGAYLIVHARKGIFVSEGGYELVLALGVTILLLAAVGAGRVSLDHVLSRRPRRVGAST